MIARTWRGWTSREDADSYLEYLHQTGLAAYRATPGNRGVYALRRIKGERAEFLLLTLWESNDAVRVFAGDDIDRAVFYPEDDRFLVDRERHVDHFDVVYGRDDSA
jgi:heme-degrading monooxygenase HmoA